MAAIQDHYTMRIGGVAREACRSGKLEVLNPATAEPLCTVPEGTAEDVADAVSAAEAAGRVWGMLSGAERADILHNAAQILKRRLPELVTLEVAQTGRPVREMSAQLSRLPEWYSYFASVARTHESAVHPFGKSYLNYSVRAPLGVVGLITPWNHPLLILTKKVAPALAAGNTVVVKPSEIAPITPLLLADILSEAGLPAGAYNVVTGFGAGAGAALTAHPGIAKLDLTGGTETGRRIGALAGERLIPFSAELGGKASVIIFEDVEPDRAASASLFASFIAAGQTCVQGARLLVHRSLHDQVLETLVRRAAKIRIGDPRNPATQMGPLVSQRQLETVQRYVGIGVQEGARLEYGGNSLQGVAGTGFFHEPVIFSGVTNEMRIAQEEIFGPVVCVIPFDDEEEAIRLANATEFGLATSVWTQNVARAHRVAQRIGAGIVWINDHHRIDPASPWGGFAASGLGKENGIVCYESYTRLQSIVVNLAEDHFDWFSDEASPKRYS